MYMQRFNKMRRIFRS